MKILALLSVMLGLQTTALATGTGAAILTKRSSAGARPPMFRDSRTVEVYVSGDARITTEKGLKETIKDKGPLSAEMMSKVIACSKLVKKSKAVEKPTCAGSGFVSYYVGAKLVSIQTCGELKTSSVACVEQVMAILDRL